MKCEQCQKETKISFEEWRELTTVMLDFAILPKEQKEMILLMSDGLLYRQEQKLINLKKLGIEPQA